MFKKKHHLNISMLSMFVLVFLQVSLHAQYSALLIPDSLKKNANAVIRVHEKTFEIVSPKKGILTEHIIITVLNEQGRSISEFNEGYDSFVTFDELKGSEYDANGKVIRRLSFDSFSDHSYTSFSLYHDNRIKSYEPTAVSYPYTVEYFYKQTYNGLFIMPSWYAQPYSNVSVQQSLFEVIDYAKSFRYKSFLITDSTITPRGNAVKYQWKTSGLKAWKDEIYSPDISTFTPWVLIAPNDFEIDKKQGRLDTWTNLGNWILQLNSGRDQLSPATVAKVNALVGNLPDTTSKIKALYEYLQQNTRYVSIQLGIGGWQPFAATEVEKEGYGDCKALSNFMQSLLKAAGINSYYVLINAGKDGGRPVYKDFACAHFNHAIVAVPLQNDTLWLECTNQKIPFGYIGSHTDDRSALVITEKGGEIWHTNSYSSKQNTQYRSANIQLQNNGNIQASVKTIYAGKQYDNVSYLLTESIDNQKKEIRDNVSLNGLKINTLTYIEHRDILPSIEENISLEATSYASIAGNRIFLPVNILNRFTSVPKQTDARVTPIVVRFNFFDADTIVFQIPVDYTIEYLPEKTEINTIFGNYISQTSSDGTNIIYIRQLEIKKGVYDKHEFANFNTFFTTIVNADKAKAILLKKQ